MEKERRREYIRRYRERHHLAKTDRRYKRLSEWEMSYILSHSDESTYQLAAFLGRSSSSIFYQLKKHGLR